MRIRTLFIHRGGNVMKNEVKCSDGEILKVRIYDLMCGTLNIEEYPVKESEYITNEFADDMFCGKAYQKIFKANMSLCDRLNVIEDNDVETIISNSLDITKHLCMKMFDYGMLLSQTKEISKDLVSFIEMYNDVVDDKKELFVKLAEAVKPLAK